MYRIFWKRKVENIKIKRKIENISENNKVILYNAFGAFGIKGLSLAVSLFTMPAYIRYFDNQQILGVWFTILSVLSWILTFDLGIGNGLRHYLVGTLVNSDHLQTKKYISSAYVVIGVIVFLSIGVTTALFKFINWNMIFNIPIEIVSKDTLNITVSIVFSGIMLQFLLKLITTILYALQKSALNNFLTLLSSIINLAYILVAKPSDISTNLITLAIVNVIAVNFPLLLATIIVFTKKLKGCKPEIRFFEKSYARDIMKLGGIFFWIQIMYMLVNTTNEILITWLTKPEMVVEYQIYNKLFTLVGILFSLALTPIWSAVTKASFEKNFTWIKKLYRTLKLMAIFAVVCEFTMIPFLQFVINLWLGNNSIQVNYLYASVFALFGSVMIWIGAITSIANGFGELKTQSIFMTVGAISKFPIAVFLVNYLDSWIGVIVANVLALAIYCIIQPIWLHNFLEKKEFEAIGNR